MTRQKGQAHLSGQQQAFALDALVGGRTHERVRAWAHGWASGRARKGRRAAELRKCVASLWGRALISSVDAPPSFRSAPSLESIAMSMSLRSMRPRWIIHTEQQHVQQGLIESLPMLVDVGVLLVCMFEACLRRIFARETCECPRVCEQELVHAAFEDDRTRQRACVHAYLCTRLCVCVCTAQEAGTGLWKLDF